jgi:hypothetical protein
MFGSSFAADAVATVEFAAAVVDAARVSDSADTAVPLCCEWLVQTQTLIWYL